MGMKRDSSGSGLAESERAVIRSLKCEGLCDTVRFGSRHFLKITVQLDCFMALLSGIFSTMAHHLKAPAETLEGVLQLIGQF